MCVHHRLLVPVGCCCALCWWRQLRAWHVGQLRSRRVYHWTQSDLRYNWYAVPEEMARQWREIPDWWKRERGLNVPKKGRGEEWALPNVVEDRLEKEMGIACIGASEVTAQSTPVSNKALVKAATRLMGTYNSLAQERIADVNFHNAKCFERWRAGDIPAEEVLQCHMVQDRPRLAALKPNLTWARRWRQKWNWPHRAVNTAGI